MQRLIDIMSLTQAERTLTSDRNLQSTSEILIESTHCVGYMSHTYSTSISLPGFRLRNTKKSRVIRL